MYYRFQANSNFQVTPSKDSSKLPATAAARGRKKKVDETSTDDLPTTAGTSDKSSPEKDGEAKKEKAGSISPKADAKKVPIFLFVDVFCPLTGAVRDKTIGDKLIYPNKIQNYHFCILKLLVNFNG